MIVFGYNFKHWKTQATITNLFFAGYKIDLVILANSVKLDFPESHTRITPRDLFLIEPQQICTRLGIQWVVCPHNESDRILKELRPTLGVIGGARILKQNIIDCFTGGIINMHPGLLPENRGLDNIKWAIIDGIPQGVTVHFISREIDRGRLILREVVPVYSDDSLLDVFVRVQNKEQELLQKHLESVPKTEYPELGEGVYHKAVTFKEEALLEQRFEYYKRNYENLTLRV